MEDSILDIDDKIALIMDQSGASAEEAARAIQDTGGDTNRALAHILDRDDDKKYKDDKLDKQGCEDEQHPSLLDKEEAGVLSLSSFSVRASNEGDVSDDEPAATCSSDVESGMLQANTRDDAPQDQRAGRQRQVLPGAFYSEDGCNAMEVSIVDEDTTIVSSSEPNASGVECPAK